MIIVAAYDISENGRRSKVAAVLQTWGDRVQKSVYVLDIADDTLALVRQKCEGMTNLDDDSLYFWPICATDWVRTICVGQAEPPARVLYWAAL